MGGHPPFNTGKGRNTGTEVGKPRGPLHRGWSTVVAGTGSWGIGWEKKPERKKSMMQGAFDAKSRNLNSLLSR